MLNAAHIPVQPTTKRWLADESPLNDLDDTESDTELDDGDLLPDEVLRAAGKGTTGPDARAWCDVGGWPAVTLATIAV